MGKPICHLNLAPHYRGGERQTELLIRELSQRGEMQRLIVKRGSALVERCSGVAGLEIREVASNPIAAGIAIKGSRVAHAHDGRTVYSGLLGYWLYGIPYIVTRRVVAPQSAKFVRRLAYGKAARLVAISHAVVESIRKRYSDVVPVVIPDASAGFTADQSKVATIRQRYAGKVLIGHVGALDQSHKGQSTIIDAARTAADKHPDWHFLLCGEGKDEQRFRDEIGNLTNIELAGWVDGVGDYLASFDAFVYPSLHEALGSTLLDALEVGLPIVASNVGGIPEFIEDGVNGILIAPDKPRELIAALEKLIEDAEWRNAMRSTNSSKAQHYTAKSMAKAYSDVYRAI